MENASKALIMAGSVLIALMIIGALVLMFGNLTSYQKTDTSTTRTTQITEFNSQFETYNRDDVRGSELYSLLNRVIDYNRRQSYEGTGSTDTGDTISYEPMIIHFNIDPKQLAADGRNNLLIKNKEYTISKTDNSFEENVENTINKLEKAYGQDSLTNLTTNLTKLFPDADVVKTYTDTEKQLLIKNFNAASKIVKIKDATDIDSKNPDTKNTIRQDAYTYYEYVQFKRAYFNCEVVQYDENTGRILRMDFVFTNKFN